MILDDLLAWWRETREPRIADLVDRVSTELAADRPPIKGKTVALRTEAWHAIAAKRDPADLGRLLATPWPGTWKTALPVLKELLAWPDDPRIAMALVRVLDERPFDTYRSDAFYLPLLRKLVDLRDVRVRPILEGIVAKPSSYWYEREVGPAQRTTLDAIAAVEPRAMDERVAAEVAELERDYGRPAADDDGAAHLAAILADPDDLAARAVYADWLTERGDPQGEFIALQLARRTRPPDAAALARERKLLEEYGAKWAGVPGAFFAEDDHVFEDGFFAGGRLEYSLGKLADHADVSAWKLVRVLHDLYGSAERLAAVEAIARLHTVGLPAPLANVVAAGPPTRPLRAIHFAGATPIGSALDTCAALPNLVELGVHADWADAAAWLARAPVVERVRRVALAGRWTTAILEALAARGGALREITLQRGAIVLSRDAAPGPFTRYRAEVRGGHPSWIAAPLNEIPVTWLRDLEIVSSQKRLTGDRSDKALVADAIRRFEALERRELPWSIEIAPLRPPPVDEGALLDVRFEGESLFTAEKAPSLWALVDELGLGFDALEAGSRIVPLAPDPVARITKWANNQRCHQIGLKREGGRSRILVWRERDRTQPSTTTMDLPMSLGGERLAGWLRRFCEIATFASGTAYARTSDLAWEAWDTSPLWSPIRGGWLTYFDAKYFALWPPDEVAKLPSIHEVQRTTTGMLVAIAPSLEAVTNDRLRAASRELGRLGCVNLLARLGSFEDRVEAALGPIAQAHGLARTTAERAPLAVRYANGEHVLLAELFHTVEHGTRVSVQLRTPGQRSVFVQEEAATGDEIDAVLAQAVPKLR